MRLEYTRQTRWAAAPDPVDETELMPGAVYVKQMIWLPCTRCDVQVHAAVTQTFASGVDCPDCGARLTAPRVLGNPDIAQARIAEVEAILRDTLGPGPWDKT